MKNVRSLGPQKRIMLKYKRIKKIDCNLPSLFDFEARNPHKCPTYWKSKTNLEKISTLPKSNDLIEFKNFNLSLVSIHSLQKHWPFRRFAQMRGIKWQKQICKETAGSLQKTGARTSVILRIYVRLKSWHRVLSEKKIVLT